MTKVNYLEKFNESLKYIKFSAKIKDSYFFDIKNTSIVIGRLESFFKKDFFEFNTKLYQGHHFSPEEDWINFHLAQCEYSIGSIFLIIEIGCVLEYFSGGNKDIELLNKKFKKKNNQINRKEFRSAFFELYVAYIFENEKFKVDIDINDLSYSQEKPLDIIVEICNKQFLIECKITNNSKSDNEFMNICFTFLNSYYNFVNSHKEESLDILKYIPVSGYISFNENKFESIKNIHQKFKNLLSKYQKDIYSAAIGKGKIQVPYSDEDKGNYEIIFEPYRKGLFENYNGLFKYKYYLKYALSNYSELIVDARFDSIDLNQKVISSLEVKKKQHKDSLIKNKIYFIEVELYAGITIRYKNAEFNINRIREKLTQDEILVILIKECDQKNGLSRKTIVIGHDSQSDVINCLNNCNWSPFYEIS